MITRREFAAGAALSPLLGSRQVLSQTGYPSRAIQMVVGFPVGQASDIGARAIAKAMGDELKQSIYVDNKPGAATIVAHQFLKAAAPDGYTIAYSSTAPMAINPTLYRNIPYDPQKDFEAIIMLNYSPLFLVTNAATPVSTFREMVAYVRTTPNVNYGSGGSGLTNHITMELLKKEANIDMLHVPYRGAPPMITDLIAGRIQFAFEVSSAILPFAQSGQVKLLGVAGLERTPAAPDIPTLHEQGLTNFESATWGVLIAPKGTPRTIIDRLNEAANRAAQTKDVREFYARNGSTPKGGTPEFCYDFMKREREKWAPIIVASGAQVD